MAPKEGTETALEMLDRLLAERGLEPESEVEIDPESGLTMSDRAKLTATGLLFNFADEAIAGIKALSPNVTYQDALAGEREQIKAAQAKDGSLKYEIGGAIVPAVATTLASIVGAPFTSGGSLAVNVPVWARLLGIGATQGFAMGAGASEEEGLARIKDTPVSTVTGMIANPAFAGLSKLAQNALAPVIDSVRRTLTGKVGKKVEDELLRLIQASDLSPEEFITRVRAGEILPEMSEEAAKFVAGFANKSGPGSGIIRDAIVGRKNKFINELYESLQNDLAPDSQGGNIFKTFSDDSEKLLKAESNAYDVIWDSTAGQTFKEIDDTVLSLANASRNSRNIINKKLDENGLKPIFKMVGKGEKQTLQLTRSLSLKEGELIKRAFMDAKIDSKVSKPDKSKTMKVYEKQIMEVLDGLSPELQATRKNWAMIEGSVKQFEVGQRIFSPKTNPEEFSIMFNRLLEAGNEDAIAALRAGAASALKLKSGGPQKVSMINKLADDPLTNMSKNEQQILQALYPGEKLDDIITKINLTSGAIKAEGNIFKGSPTAGREGAANRVGLGQTVADVGRIVSSNGLDVGAARNIITRMFGGKKPDFTDEQFEQIARLVISEDSELLRRAMTNDTQIDAIYQAFSKAINALGASQPRVTALTDVTEPAGDIVDPSVTGALTGLISTVSPSTALKIQQAVAQ